MKAMQSAKTRSEAAVLVLVVFLLGALLGGMAVHLWSDRVFGNPIVPGHPTRDQIVSSLTKELQLNAEQQQQLAAIIDDTRAQIAVVYAPADAQRDELRQKGRARIRAILTPEQKPKFEAFMHNLDEQRKKTEQYH
jgi:Spy/CpxP family protein refolding chaperone